MIRIDIDTWTVKQLKDGADDGTLILNPEYQRREVWKERDKILLVDSIARRLPIGALTLFKEEQSGYDTFEVIDGKQRCTAILDYLSDEFPLNSKIIRKTLEEDDDENPLNEDAVALYDRLWSELNPAEKQRILQYRVPIFVVEGSREDAVFAFYRMNKVNYALRPQEIRNALFTNSLFLKQIIGLEQRLSEDLSGGQHFLGAIGAVSRQALERMQDIQLLSELLILLLHGVQHRRDTIDRYYVVYRNGGKDELDKAANQLYRILSQVYEILEMQPLQSWHFPSNCENDFYALVGAFARRTPLSGPQVQKFGRALAASLSEFRRQVEIFVRATRERAIAPDEFSELVEEYGRTFLGGQVNGQDRRESRIKILLEIINGVVESLDGRRSFSEAQRMAIWARSVDKLCARCGEKVEWRDFHAGHKVPHALGGRTEIENGQVEHRHCNQAAGASE